MITLGWQEQVWRAESTDTVRIDLGERPKMALHTEARAVVWSRVTTEADLDSARRHAERDGLQVFTLPDDHPDPLGFTRAQILAGVP